MRKGDKGMNVFGAILILAIIVSVFSGAVSADDLLGGLKQSVDDAEIQTVVGNLSSEELTEALDAVTDDTVNIEFADQSVELSVVSSRSSYDPQTAVNYADTWWNGRNPNYHDYSSEGGDCANFVSQCLIAGGCDLSGHPGADSWGCIPSCTNLHDYLVNYLGATHETRPKSQAEPIWFVPGDPAIFPTPKHAVFAVTGDATHYATCNAHSTDRYHMTIQWFFDNSNWNSCTYYNIPTDILQPPSPPTLTSPGTSSEPGEEIDTLTPTFRWQAVSGADCYGLYISKYPYGSSNIVYANEAISGSSTSLPLSSGYLQDGVKYRWNMRAHNSAGWSSYGIENGKTRLFFWVNIPQPPSPPTLTSPGTSSEPGEEIDTLTPTFRWQAVSGADCYGLYISKYPYGSSNIVYANEAISGSSTSLPLSSGYLQDGVKYRWNMRAHNSAGWSSYGIENGKTRLFFWVNIPQPPSPPTLTSPGTSSEPGEEIDTLTPTFRWQAVSGADCYGLYISKYPYGSSNIVYENEAISGSSTSLPLSSGYLQDGVKYRWNMRAHNSAGWSSYGIEDGKTRLFFWVNIPQPPSPPTLTSPGTSSEPGEEIDTLTPTFRWQAVSGADCYGLYISKYPYGSSNIVYENEAISGSSTSLPLSSGYLQDGVKYRWNMRAHNSAGWSSYGIEDGKTRLFFWVNIPQPPSPPTLTSPGTSSEPGEEIDTLTPTFRWQAVSGADCYGLYISKYPYGSSNIVYANEAISGSSTSLPLSSGYLQDGVKYRWNMRAHNSAGWSSYGIEDGKTRLFFWVKEEVYYDSQAAVNYAINYAYKACGCGGYYGSSPPPQGSGTSLGSNGDCAHFVSHCLAAGELSNKGSEYATGWCEGGAHDYIISVSKMRDWFTETGIATKVSSVNQLVLGDVIVTNSYGHVVLYIGSYDGKSHQVASHSAWGIFSYTYFGTPNEYWHITSASLTDQQKQQEILTMVNSHRGSLPAELVLAVIRQEGGEGAFHVDGWNYDTFYRESDGPWAQPTTNDDGIMQVTAASGYHERSGPYTHDCTGYDHAINDGCDYLLELHSTYTTQVQSTLHYNTGPKSLYIYLGMNQGDKDYLSKVAEHLSSFVPNTYGLSNQNLVNALNQGQNILDKYLYDMGIATDQSVGYYEPYQTQLDNELHAIETPNDPPNTPSRPSGPTPGQIGNSYQYSTVTTDPNSDNVYYWFDWGDDTNSGWIGPYPSGTSGCASKEWSNPDTYNVKTKAKDDHGAESSPLWSDSLQVCICRETGCSAVFRNGWWYADTNGDHKTDTYRKYGISGDKPVVGDIDNNGINDMVAYRNGWWYVSKEDHTGTDMTKTFKYGISGDTPLIGDIDNNGVVDAVAFRNGWWYVAKEDHTGTDMTKTFKYGIAGDTPLIGDIDNNGVVDAVIFRNGWWYVAKEDHTGTDWTKTFKYGISGDKPILDDIHNDGSIDTAVLRNGWWYVSKMDHSGTDYGFKYGITGDLPIQNTFV